MGLMFNGRDIYYRYLEDGEEKREVIPSDDLICHRDTEVEGFNDFKLSDLLYFLSKDRHYWVLILGKKIGDVIDVFSSRTYGTDEDLPNLARIEVHFTYDITIWDADVGPCLNKNSMATGVDAEGETYALDFIDIEHLLDVPLYLNDQAPFFPNPKKVKEGDCVHVCIRVTLEDVLKTLLMELDLDARAQRENLLALVDDVGTEDERESNRTGAQEFFDGIKAIRDTPEVLKAEGIYRLLMISILSS